MEKTIDVTLSVNGDDLCVDFYEHETGDSYGLSFTRNELDTPGLAKQVGDEILDWFHLMLED